MDKLCFDLYFDYRRFPLSAKLNESFQYVVKPTPSDSPRVQGLLNYKGMSPDP